MQICNSTLQLFSLACLVYLSSDVRSTIELGDYLNQEGVSNPLPGLNNSPENKYLESFEAKKLQSRAYVILTVLIILIK